MTELSRRHDLTAAMLVDDDFDTEECRQAMQAYCREVVLVPNPYGQNARIGQSAKQLAVDRYSWSGVALKLEGFYRRILEVNS
jgi:hypothetical protein